MDTDRSRRLAIALTAALAAAAPVAAAQLVPVGPEQLLSSTGSCALTAGRADGRYALAWGDGDRDSDLTSLRVQVVDEDDHVLPAVELEQDAADSDLDSLRATASGFVLQWFHPGIAADLRTQLLDPAGVPVGSLLVNPLDGPAVVYSARPVGGYVVLRRARAGVQVSLRDAHGARVGRSRLIGDPYVAVSTVEHRPDGAFVVFYWSIELRGAREIDRGVRAVWFTRDGQVAGKSFVVAPPSWLMLERAVGADGTLAVISRPPEAPRALLVRVFDARGRELGSWPLPDAIDEETVAVDDQGKVLIVTTASTPSDPIFEVATAQLLSRRAEPLAPPLVLAVPPPSSVSGAQCPQAVPTGGGWAVSWVSIDAEFHVELRARRLEIAP